MVGGLVETLHPLKAWPEHVTFATAGPPSPVRGFSGTFIDVIGGDGKDLDQGFRIPSSLRPSLVILGTTDPVIRQDGIGWPVSGPRMVAGMMVWSACGTVGN